MGAGPVKTLTYEVRAKSDEARQLEEQLKRVRDEIAANVEQFLAGTQTADQMAVKMVELGQREDALAASAATMTDALAAQHQALSKAAAGIGQFQINANTAIEGIVRMGGVSTDTAKELRGYVDASGDLGKAMVFLMQNQKELFASSKAGIPVIGAAAQATVSGGAAAGGAATSIIGMSAAISKALPVLAALQGAWSVGTKTGEAFGAAAEMAINKGLEAAGKKPTFDRKTFGNDAMAEAMQNYRELPLLQQAMNPAMMALAHSFSDIGDNAGKTARQVEQLSTIMKEQGVSMEEATSILAQSGAAKAQMLKNLAEGGIEFARELESQAQNIIAYVDAGQSAFGGLEESLKRFGPQVEEMAQKLATAEGPVGKNGQAVLDLAEKYRMMQASADDAAATAQQGAGAIGAQSDAMADATAKALAFADAQQVVADRTKAAGDAAVQQASQVVGAFARMDAEMAAFMASTRFRDASGNQFGPGQGFSRQFRPPPGESAPNG